MQVIEIQPTPGNDTQNVQSAINSLSNGIVLFSPGIYTLDAMINLKDNVSLMGKVKHGAVIRKTNNGNMFYGTAVSDVEINGLSFDGLNNQCTPIGFGGERIYRRLFWL